jgi:hypothetical protein
VFVIVQGFLSALDVTQGYAVTVVPPPPVPTTTAKFAGGSGGAGRGKHREHSGAAEIDYLKNQRIIEQQEADKRQAKEAAKKKRQRDFAVAIGVAMAMMD